MPTITQPQPRQRTVISCPYDEILFGGTAGAGKTYLLALDWVAHMTTYGKDAYGVLFRNTYLELEDINRKMHEIYPDIGGTWKDKIFAWGFKNGATLRLSYLNSFEDALKHKGFEYTWRAHDELTQRPTDEEYVYLNSRMRSPAPHVRPRILCASNPDGPGHLWVKKWWKIDRFQHGMKPFHTYTDHKNNLLLTEEEGKKYDGLPDEGLPEHIRRNTRIFIPGRLEDNEYLNKNGEYRSRLLALPEAQRRMLLDGNWDVVEGAFFDEWDPKYHVVRAFKPPDDWKRWMAGDWGTTSPYAFVWFCQAPNGEVYIYRELVGYKPGKLNEGVREAPSTVAEKIRAIEHENEEWIQERWLDASCFDNDELGLSVSEQFRSKGLIFQKSQKKFKSGSISMFRDYLKVTNGMCRFHIMDNCPYSIMTIPLLMVDKHRVELYDSDGPDHAVDAILYGIRRNIKSKEEIDKDRGVVDRNRRVLRRFGSYGAH